MKKISKKEQRMQDNKFWYGHRWGNYKFDKWKKKSILKSEINSLLYLGSYSKNDLIKIKDKLKELGFKRER